MNLCLIVLLVLAGCTAGPFDPAPKQNQPVELIMNNSANATQTFEIWVVKAGSNVTVRYNDSRTANATVGEGLRTFSSAEYYYTAVEPPDSAELHGRFRVGPGKENRSSIEKFRQDSAVLVVLYQDGKIGWYAIAHCSDGALVGVNVKTRPSQTGGDAGAGYGCR
jgi:hypothetical protein